MGCNSGGHVQLWRPRATLAATQARRGRQNCVWPPELRRAAEVDGEWMLRLGAALGHGRGLAQPALDAGDVRGGQ